MSSSEEILEIFSWFPAKTLYKFSPVCKTLNQLLSEDFFVKKQFRNMEMLEATDFFIQPDLSGQRFGCIKELHGLSPDIPKNTVPHESLEFLANKGKILASYNGLLCCRDTNDNKNELFLFNPTTKNYLQIPLPDERLSKDSNVNVVFDCDNDHNDSLHNYLLLALVNSPTWGQFHVKIYSPDENIWRDRATIDLGKRCIQFKYSVQQNGVIYMVSDYAYYIAKPSPFYEPYIAVYDIKSSTSILLAMPKGTRKGLVSKLAIFKWGKDSICLVKMSKNIFTIWELIISSNGNLISKYSWSRVAKMRVLEQEVTGFTVLNGSILLFATDQEKIYGCKLGDGSYGQAAEICEHQHRDSPVCFNSFHSTLRPCGPGAVTLQENEL